MSQADRCAWCNGPLLSEGVETDMGDTVHAVCKAQGGADLDMNPEKKRELRSLARQGRLRPWMLRGIVPDGVDPAELSNQQVRRLLS